MQAQSTLASFCKTSSIPLLLGKDPYNGTVKTVPYKKAERTVVFVDIIKTERTVVPVDIIKTERIVVPVDMLKTKRTVVPVDIIKTERTVTLVDMLVGNGLDRSAFSYKARLHRSAKHPLYRCPLATTSTKKRRNTAYPLHLLLMLLSTPITTRQNFMVCFILHKTNFRMTRASYIHFTDEQKYRANSVDIIDFLQRQGVALACSGYKWCWKWHDSVTVRGNKWFRHCEQSGGYPIDFVQEFCSIPTQPFTPKTNDLLQKIHAKGRRHHSEPIGSPSWRRPSKGRVGGRLFRHRLSYGVNLYFYKR